MANVKSAVYVALVGIVFLASLMLMLSPGGGNFRSKAANVFGGVLLVLFLLGASFLLVASHFG